MASAINLLNYPTKLIQVVVYLRINYQVVTKLGENYENLSFGNSKKPLLVKGSNIMLLSIARWVPEL